MEKTFLRQLFALLICTCFCISTNAAVLNDYDGSAFITKKEFENMKEEFQHQIDLYDKVIDEKIDAKISSYLDSNRIDMLGYEIVQTGLTMYWQTSLLSSTLGVNLGNSYLGTGTRTDAYSNSFYVHYGSSVYGTYSSQPWANVVFQIEKKEDISDDILHPVDTWQSFYLKCSTGQTTAGSQRVLLFDSNQYLVGFGSVKINASWYISISVSPTTDKGIAIQKINVGNNNFSSPNVEIEYFEFGTSSNELLNTLYYDQPVQISGVSAIPSDDSAISYTSIYVTERQTISSPNSKIFWSASLIGFSTLIERSDSHYKGINFPAIMEPKLSDRCLVLFCSENDFNEEFFTSGIISGDHVNSVSRIVNRMTLLPLNMYVISSVSMLGWPTSATKSVSLAISNNWLWPKSAIIVSDLCDFKIKVFKDAWGIDAYYGGGLPIFSASRDGILQFSMRLMLSNARYSYSGINIGFIKSQLRTESSSPEFFSYELNFLDLSYDIVSTAIFTWSFTSSANPTIQSVVRYSPITIKLKMKADEVAYLYYSNVRAGAFYTASNNQGIVQVGDAMFKVE